MKERAGFSNLFERLDVRAAMKRLVGLARTHKLETAAVSLALAVTSLYALQGILGVDESDNFLAAKLILSGEVPYADFFSHHMPGGYLLSTILYLFSAGNLLAFRLLTYTLFIAWLLYNFITIRRFASRSAALVYIVLASLIFGLSLQYQFLAETFVALLVSSIIIWLLLLDTAKLQTGRWLAILSLSLFGIPFMALSYVYVAMLLYVFAFIRLRYFRERTFRSLAIFATPYLLFGAYLLATGSLRDFMFQNLTFNTEYYSVFLDRAETDPLAAAIDIVRTSLLQIWTVLTDPLTYHKSLLLLFACLSLPIVLLIRGKRLAGIILVIILLFANSRVSLYGTPAIQNFDVVSHHAGLYRTLAVLFFSLAVFYVGPRNWRLPAKGRQYVRLSALLVFGMLAGFLALANFKAYGPGPIASIERYRQLPGEGVHIINAVAEPDDHAWTGALNFLGQSYLQPKIATEYTFYMPWHQLCGKCRDEFYSQLRAQHPIAIEWRPFRSIPGHPLPGYGDDMRAFLDANYFQVETTSPGFDDIYFSEAHRFTVMQRLRSAGYTVE